jgi:DNA-binding PadR family transcriptional regulator
MYPDFNLRQVRESGNGYKENHHSSLKRALQLLAKGGYLEVGYARPERYRVTLRRLYRLTEKGKCALSKLHTYLESSVASPRMPSSGDVSPIPAEPPCD